MLEGKILHKCLSIIILDSVTYAYEKHPQIFSEECKYMKKKQNKQNKQTNNYIDMELESESDRYSDSDIYM